ncbi:hypothetical protein GQ55_6G040600 [Panicum hallii var. hallii]|uniref:FAD-binding PCMH-type domain-containing protein n=1 Tax=Panicum hallii var. hallii TaxID=1504633 RepID=A0A2T7D3R8_9POAL|nr:hypothetical protein GQ55_6G040600 [Panicum hallii var. hallii]
MASRTSPSRRPRATPRSSTPPSATSASRSRASAGRSPWCSRDPGTASAPPSSARAAPRWPAVRVRSGGHSYEGLSYTTENHVPFAVIDLARLNRVRVGRGRGRRDPGRALPRRGPVQPVPGVPGRVLLDRRAGRHHLRRRVRAPGAEARARRRQRAGRRPRRRERRGPRPARDGRRRVLGRQRRLRLVHRPGVGTKAPRNVRAAPELPRATVDRVGASRDELARRDRAVRRPRHGRRPPEPGARIQAVIQGQVRLRPVTDPAPRRGGRRPAPLDGAARGRVRHPGPLRRRHGPVRKRRHALL